MILLRPFRFFEADFLVLVLKSRCGLLEVVLVVLSGVRIWGCRIFELTTCFAVWKSVSITRCLLSTLNMHVKNVPPHQSRDPHPLSIGKRFISALLHICLDVL